jgi:leucyl-tRNA synthetase
MEPYNPKNIEGKWQKAWADAKLYETDIATIQGKALRLGYVPISFR